MVVGGTGGGGGVPISPYSKYAFLIWSLFEVIWNHFKVSNAFSGSLKKLIVPIFRCQNTFTLMYHVLFFVMIVFNLRSIISCWMFFLPGALPRGWMFISPLVRLFDGQNKHLHHRPPRPERAVHTETKILDMQKQPRLLQTCLTVKNRPLSPEYPFWLINHPPQKNLICINE